MRLIDANKLMLWLNDVWYSSFKYEELPTSIAVKEAMKAIVEYVNTQTDVEPSGDLISRGQAIEAVVCHIWHLPNELYKRFNCENVVRDVVTDAINRIPSDEAEQVTGKLKNPCDSLLTADSDECKEQEDGDE